MEKIQIKKNMRLAIVSRLKVENLKKVNQGIQKEEKRKFIQAL